MLTPPADARAAGFALAAPSGRRLERSLTCSLELFSALCAVGGGLALLVWQTGNRYLPLRLVEHTPFHSFLVPGLLLTLVVGGSSLVALVLTWRRSPASAYATSVAGAALSVWIVAEAAMMRGVHWLHVIFGALGLAILTLGIRAAWRARLRRQRWLLFVTGGEALGFLVPTLTGLLANRAALGEASQAALVVVAGFAEGALLGLGQALAFPFRVRRGVYVLLSASGAALVWASVMAMTVFFGARAQPLALVVVAVAVTALLGLTGIGSAQWLELRRSTPSARPWILWTALAWLLALPLSFTPMPFVDESTPLASAFALWACAGLLMAHVMALVTWQGVRRLQSGESRVSIAE